MLSIYVLISHRFEQKTVERGKSVNTILSKALVVEVGNMKWNIYWPLYSAAIKKTGSLSLRDIAFCHAVYVRAPYDPYSKHTLLPLIHLTGLIILMGANLLFCDVRTEIYAKSKWRVRLQNIKPFPFSEERPVCIKFVAFVYNVIKEPDGFESVQDLSLRNVSTFCVLKWTYEIECFQNWQ